MKGPIYTRINYENALGIKKEVLNSRANLLVMLRKIENYKTLRAQEFILKIKLKNTMKETREKIAKLGEVLPKVEMPKQKKDIVQGNIQENAPILKKEPSAKDRIERELDEIK